MRRPSNQPTKKIEGKKKKAANIFKEIHEVNHCVAGKKSAW